MPRPRPARPGPNSSELDEAYDPGIPSRTQQKRESDALQVLGKELLALPDSRLALIDLPETLRFALRDAKKITANEGKRRQVQYIGKLMRKVDPEPLREAVAAFKLGHAHDQLRLHQLEALRGQLVESDEVLQTYVTDHPDVDVQQLRSLVRAARKDAAAEPEARSGRGFRELFQFLKEQP